MTPWTCIVLGCGTVGYWIAEALPDWPVSRALARLVLCDKGAVREHNAITCPKYAGHVGRRKAERLAEILRTTSNFPVLSAAVRVEQLDWSALIPSGDGSKTVVIMGLDVWQSRLCVAEDLRSLPDSTTRKNDTLLIQIGLDRNQAQVCVFGISYCDPCPACGMTTLPSSEPCVAFSADSHLLRGNLQREAQAAADHVLKIVTDSLDGSDGWTNTKTNLLVAEHALVTRSSRRRDACLGPHSGDVPVRWDSVLPNLALGGPAS